MDTLELIARVFDPLDRQNLIDIGCGPGQLCATLARRGAVMTGIDPSAEIIDLARQRAGAGRFMAVTADILPFPDAVFTGAIFLNSLHHIPAMATALEEAARVVGPGRPVLVIEPATRGTFFDAMLPIEDETAVRREAQAMIAASIDAGVLEEREVLDFERVETFADLDAFLDRVAAADTRRRATIARYRPEIEAAFLRAATRDEGGRFVLMQPLHARVLAVPAVSQ
jgi:SAM-dependent methyltransferase